VEGAPLGSSRGYSDVAEAFASGTERDSKA
jgi:hypothetical protein